MTGFRVSPRGLVRPGRACGPDLMTFGKVMGGGFPAAAFGGRADVMAHLAPAGPVYQAGTLSGNPVATAAGLATLRLRDDDVYAHVDKAAAELGGAGVSDALTAAGVAAPAAARRQHVLGLLQPGRRRAVTDYDGAPRQDVFRFAAFFHAMLDRGRLPAAVGVRVVVPVRRARRRGARPGRRRAARRRPRGRRGHARGAPDDARRTVVHLLRHGEVHNPTGVLYGRLPGYHLSELGRAMAERVADAPHGRGHRRTSCPRRWSGRRRRREPGRRGARPARSRTDERLIEAGNVFEGKTFGVGDGSLRQPAALGATCATRSGRPGASPTTRSPRGCSPPSPPRATPPAATRRSASATSCRSGPPGRRDGRRLWHDPRRRQCALASLTSFTYDGDELVVGRPTPSRRATCCPRRSPRARSSSPEPDEQHWHGPGTATGRGGSALLLALVIAAVLPGCSGGGGRRRRRAGLHRRRRHRHRSWRRPTADDAGPVLRAPRSTARRFDVARPPRRRSSWSTSGARGARRASPRRPPCRRSGPRPAPEACSSSASTSATTGTPRRRTSGGSA